MKYLEDPRLTQLTSDLTEAFLNTRGSGSPSSSGIRNIGHRRHSNKGSKAKNNKHGSSSSQSASAQKPPSSSPYLPPSTFHYAPAGYTSYDGGTSSSSRVIYGKIEAYTTKRAGSDKKIAHEVGERYAHEMRRMNEAVEAMKRRHAGEKAQGEEGDHDEKWGEGEQQPKRTRSRSLDGVTFASATTPTLPEIETHPSSSSPTIDENLHANHPAKRTLPEGILKPPNSKRWRATSFDVSTGPSSPGIVPNNRRGRIVSAGNGDEADSDLRPLMPQPSLYRSSFADSAGTMSSSLPAVAPRRLVTDLILTLNASFPDYDFGEARPGDFCTLSVQEAMRRINENMSEFVSSTDKGRDFMPRFWAALDDIVFGLKDAEVYSYSPQSGGGDDDPLGFLTQTLAGGIDSAPSSAGCLLFPSEDTMTMDGLVDNSTTLELPHRILTSPVTNSEDTAQVTLWSMNYFFVSRNKKRIVLFTCVQTMRSPQGGVDDEEEGDEYQYCENDLVFDEARRSKTQEEKENEYASYPVSNGDESVVVEDVDNYGVDVEVDEDEDVGDEDQEERDFDTGALNASVHPPSSPDQMMTA